MRVLSFTIAILILVMSCIPCSDTGCMAMDSLKTDRNIARAEHSHAGGQEHKDLCSPFCQCACCALTFTLPPLPDVQLQAAARCPGRPDTLYIQRSPRNIALPVWQPPQLS